LRKSPPCGILIFVQTFYVSKVFLQYGTSARQAAPLIFMPAPVPFPRKRRGIARGTLCAWKKVVFATSASTQLESGRDGAGTLRVPAVAGCGLYVEPMLNGDAEDHRVRRRSIRPVGGFTCSIWVSNKDLAQLGVSSTFAWSATSEVWNRTNSDKAIPFLIPQEHAQYG
jgi:hypothetical protein